MKSEKRWRYQCDYCKKWGGSAPHMKKHELHCTLNPRRECGMCKIVAGGRDSDFVQSPLAEIVASLPDPEILLSSQWDFRNELASEQTMQTGIQTALSELRRKTGNCPACMLAALRQRGHCVPMFEGFNYKTESEDALRMWSEDQNRQDYSHYHGGFY